MKSTNVIPNNSQNTGNTKGAGFQIKPAQIVNVGDLIADAKANNPDAIKEPTTYPAPTPEAEATEPATAPATEPAPAAPEASAPVTEPVTPPAPEPAAPAQTMALIKSRSRSEEIDYQIEKSRQLQLINTQLQGLKGKETELKQFSFAVDKDEDYRYARIAIYDDGNREFQCKNHALVALVVEHLRTLFSGKIEEKEDELLNVSKS